VFLFHVIASWGLSLQEQAIDQSECRSDMEAGQVNSDFSQGFAVKQCQCVSNAELLERYSVFTISSNAV
jgi:hypothetical protein